MVESLRIIHSRVKKATGIMLYINLICLALHLFVTSSNYIQIILQIILHKIDRCILVSQQIESGPWSMYGAVQNPVIYRFDDRSLVRHRYVETHAHVSAKGKFTSFRYKSYFVAKTDQRYGTF